MKFYFKTLRAKLRKLKEFLKLYLEWCREFDMNVQKILMGKK